MRLIYKLSIVITTISFVVIATQARAQNIRATQNDYFYIGVDLNLLTLASGTSIKSTLGIKAGYNRLLTDNIFVGPQVKALFIQNPARKGIKPSIFAGASSEFEVTKFMSNDYLLEDVSQFSSRLSWVFPVNAASSDFVYKDCISISASYKSSKFNFYRSSVDLNLDFQGYDIGFYNGFNRMVNLSTGSISAFK